MHHLTETTADTHPAGEPPRLLPDDRDFVINPVADSYRQDIHITCRSPRQREGGGVSLVTVTTTLDAGALKQLRVETMDGRWYVINEAVAPHGEALRLPVVSAAVGHALVRAIVSEGAEGAPGHTATLARRARASEVLIPWIWTVCGVLLTGAAGVWLLRDTFSL